MNRYQQAARHLWDRGGWTRGLMLRVIVAHARLIMLWETIRG